MCSEKSTPTDIPSCMLKASEILSFPELFLLLQDKQHIKQTGRKMYGAVDA